MWVMVLWRRHEQLSVHRPLALIRVMEQTAGTGVCFPSDARSRSAKRQGRASWEVQSLHLPHSLQ